MGQPTHLKKCNPELLLSKGNVEMKTGAETEGKATQRPLYLGIHPICRDTIADVKNYLLTGAWYSCLLKGSAST